MTSLKQSILMHQMISKQDALMLVLIIALSTVCCNRIILAVFFLFCCPKNTSC